jgi:hypothetical protein
MFTPWGKADFVSTLADGVVSVSTPSHGGIYLDGARNAVVHEVWRDTSAAAGGGWHEEIDPIT